MILFDLLPKTRPHAKAGLAPGAAFFAGAVQSDGGLQPRDTTRQFPQAVRKLCEFIHQADAAHPFGAFVILRNVHSSLHRDHNNTNSPNLVVPITAFEGGGVWVEHEGGQDFRWHRTHSFQDGPLYLQARTLLHETLPWEGDRAIIAAYMPANLDSLRPTDAAFLQSLGFHWQSDRPPVDEGHVGFSSLPSSLPVLVLLLTPARVLTLRVVPVYEMCKHEFTDGFGLCSPGRWAPEAREMLASKEEAGHAREIRDLLRKFVHSEIKDVRAEAFKLATGRLKGSPFSEVALSRIRGQIASVLGNPPDALEVPERQPLFLNLLARSLKALGDPDYDILVSGEECFARGVSVGYDAPLPRAPQIFRPREKFRKLDETEFEPQMENYASAEMSSEQLEAHFREDERKGMMVATTEGKVRQEFGEGRLLVAAMGALQKPNGEVRPLHDGTHGIRLNNHIVIEDRLEVPGPPEMIEMAARARDTKEAPLAISADIAQAHRRVKIRRNQP
eukprot:s6312_g4.t1